MNKDYKKSIELYTDVMNKRIKTLGRDHEKTIATKSSLADCYKLQKNYTKAIELNTDVLNQRIEILGNDNQKTLSTKSNLITLFQLKSCNIENIEEFEQSLIKGFEDQVHL